MSQVREQGPQVDQGWKGSVVGGEVPLLLKRIAATSYALKVLVRMITNLYFIRFTTRPSEMLKSVTLMRSRVVSPMSVDCAKAY